MADGQARGRQDTAQTDRRARLVRLMAAMAAGDHAAIFLLATEFRTPLAGAVRRHLRRMGVERVDAADLDGLVIDACIELSRVAGGWDPAGGALPWTWAERRISAAVAAHVGIHADHLDDDTHRVLAEQPAEPNGPAATEDPDPLLLLDRRAGRRPDCELVQEALGRVASARNQRIVLGVRLQAALGDPSPAGTVGREEGLQPDAVRQVVHRTRRALRQLADGASRFAPLAATALVA